MVRIRHEPPDPSLPARLRASHQMLPLAEDPGNARFPDDRILYSVALLRDTPVPAPALSPEEWQAFPRPAPAAQGPYNAHEPAP